MTLLIPGGATARMALGLCLIAVIGSPEVLQAQTNPQDLPEIEVTGEVTKVRRGYVELKSERARLLGRDVDETLKEEVEMTTDYVVALHPKESEVKVFGTGDAGVLKSGQYVKFKGKVDKEDKPQGAVTKVEVVLPDPSFEPMAKKLLPAPSFVKNKKLPDLFTLEVAGRVVSNRGGKLTVLVGPNQRLMVQLDEKAQVRFTITDYSQANPGDKVTIRGRLFRSGQILAQSASIFLKEEEKKSGGE